MSDADGKRSPGPGHTGPGLMILAACGALTACSDGGDATVNRVDLNAAAARAEDDIANYAVITNAEGANDAIEARDRRPPRE